jgi:hypothetical protein
MNRPRVPPIRQLGMRKRCKKDIFALNKTPARSMMAKLPNNNIESNENGICILALWRIIV